MSPWAHILGMNKYAIQCMTETARYRGLAMRQDTGKHLYIHLAHVWLKRAALAHRAIKKNVA